MPFTSSTPYTGDPQALRATLLADCLPRLKDAVRRADVRYIEVRFERSLLSRVVYRGRFLQDCSTNRECGGIVRALSSAGWGIATFNDLERLELAVKSAADCARAVTGERIELAPATPINGTFTYKMGEDLRAVPLDEKRELLEGYNQRLLSHDPRITDSVAVYREQLRDVFFVNSDGAAFQRSGSTVDLGVSAIAKAGNDVQSGRVGDAFNDCGFEVVRGRDDWADRAAGDAIANLAARPVEGGVYTVICDPEMTGLFTHEAFGHLSEADHQFMNPELQESMRPGRVFGQPILNIFDSGVENPILLGSIPVDDEGTPTRRTALIEEGRLVGRLHSRETAAKMGETPTGSARAESYLHAPIVRMRNTAIAPGESSFDEMIAGIEDGVYASGGGGGQTRLGNFSFTASHGFRIRHGKLAERVRDVVLAGNIFKTLANIDAVGNDPGWICAGRCGKLGQQMTVGLGGPHVRIRDVVIGGH